MNKKIGVLHLISGDLWAGAEVQAYTLLSTLKRDEKLKLIAVVLNEGNLASLLRAQGIKVYVVDEKKTISPLILLKLVSILRSEQPDIIHTHRYKENIIGGLASLFSRTKCRVRTVHGLTEKISGSRGVKSGIISILDRLITRLFFQRIITVSYDIKRHLQKKFPARMIEVIHNGIDLGGLNGSKNPVETKRLLGIEEGNPLIGAVGRLVPIKGFEHFIRASKIILRSRKDVRFILVGDGPLRKRLQKLVGDIGISQKFYLLGFREDILNIINAMDIFVITSIHEGIPMSLLEAMALRKPVVATSVGGIPEVIKPGVNGLLIPVNDEKELADKCLNLLDDISLAENISEQAQEFIRESFTSKSMAQLTLSLYSFGLGATELR